MIFNSIPFIIFLPIVALGFYIIPQKFKVLWLLIASYFFYMCQDTAFVSLLIFSTIITYGAGILLGRINFAASSHAIFLRRFTATFAVIINLAILIIFKYADFFLELFGSSVRFSLLLPIGISFYTFEALSYIIDVYRGKITPERNILKLALYLSFFLNILSGPINRASDMLPEVSKRVTFDLENVKVGFQKMLWGYFLKLCVAARLSIIVDNVYANIDGYRGLSLAAAAVFYLFMLYCDFEGYSQIAIGAARIMGIRMQENFRQPFYSDSMSILWRRWHVSLSSWFRDYLYIPLGGNRKGTARKYLNLIIVLFLSGVWHGANLTFFIWGLLNGIFIVAGQITIGVRDNIAARLKITGGLRLFLKRCGVYILYAFTFIFFANDSVNNAFMAIRGIFLRFEISPSAIMEIFGLGLGKFNLLLVILMMLLVMIVDGKCFKRDCDFSALMKVTPTYIRWGLYYAMLIMILFSANLSGKEFIYSKM